VTSASTKLYPEEGKAVSSKIFVPIYQSRQQYNSEDCKLNTNHCEDLKSHTGYLTPTEVIAIYD
jgi:hypothetical protein